VLVTFIFLEFGWPGDDHVWSKYVTIITW